MTAEIVSQKGTHVSSSASVVLLLVAALLNHAQVLFGVNMSLADPVVAGVVVLAVAAGRVAIPRYAVLFLCLIFAVSSAVSLFLVPLWGAPVPSMVSIVRDSIRLLSALSYFVVGIIVVASHAPRLFFRVYYCVATVVGGYGVMATIVPWLPKFEWLYDGSFRFSGLMDDPNLYATLTLVALAFLSSDRGAPKMRGACAVILTAAVLLTGSKTGSVVLSMYVLMLSARWVSAQSRTGRHAGLPAIRALALSVLAIGMMALTPWLQESIPTHDLPAIDRALSVFHHGAGALYGDGSARTAVWESGFSMALLSPWTGVGLGSYLEVNAAVVGGESVAHNTYLQLAAEWGIPIALVFFGWVIGILRSRPSNISGDEAIVWRQAADGLMILMAASLTISLNNARILWLVLGVLVGLVMKHQQTSQYGTGRNRG